jgi:hypothetical protein
MTGFQVKNIEEMRRLVEAFDPHYARIFLETQIKVLNYLSNLPKGEDIRLDELSKEIGYSNIGHPLYSSDLQPLANYGLIELPDMSHCKITEVGRIFLPELDKFTEIILSSRNAKK